MEKVLEKLRELGYKLTPQRIAIIKYLTERGSHVTAEEILKGLGDAYPTMSLATVYSTLEILSNIGLVQELGFAKGPTRYETNMEPHINMVCVKCGSITDLQEDIAKQVLDRVKQRTDFKVKGQRFEVYGECGTCSSNT